MTNYVQPGKILSLTAGSAISSGDPVQVGQIFGVAVADAASGATVEVAVEGVFELACASADVIAEGDLLYWDGSQLTKTASENLLVGAAVTAAGTGVTSCQVVLSTGPRADEPA